MTVVICAKFCHRLRTSSTTITISSNNLLNYVAADQLRSLLLVRRTITTKQGRRHVGEAAVLPGKLEILPHLEETSFYSTLVLVPCCRDNKERLIKVNFLWESSAAQSRRFYLALYLFLPSRTNYEIFSPVQYTSCVTLGFICHSASCLFEHKSWHSNS